MTQQAIDGLREKPKKGEPLKNNHMKSVLMRIFNETEAEFDAKWEHNKAVKDQSGKTLKIPGRRYFCPDFCCEKMTPKLIIEVDGDSRTCSNHYSYAQTIVEEKLRDEVCKKAGYRVVRIPYYIQLDNTMLEHFFGVTYPEPLYETASMHGFAHPNCSLPSSFCELGIAKFEEEMTKWPDSVQLKIIETLRERKRQFIDEGYSEEDAQKLVVPDKLAYLLE